MALTSFRLEPSDNERAGNTLCVIDRRSIRAGEAVLLDADVIHDLSTCPDEPTCSIHVYGGDLYESRDHSMWPLPSLEEKPYEEQEFFRRSREMMRAI